jgi:hypothetical protein
MDRIEPGQEFEVERGDKASEFKNRLFAITTSNQRIE